jgi:hypothetical protein
MRIPSPCFHAAALQQAHAILDEAALAGNAANAKS